MSSSHSGSRLCSSVVYCCWSGGYSPQPEPAYLGGWIPRPPDDPYPSAEHQLDKGAVEVMNEIPERIEREMFEIRSRMAPDVRDLKKHAEPQARLKRTSTKVKERVRDAVIRFGKSLKESASRQAKMIGEAGRKRNP